MTQLSDKFHEVDWLHLSLFIYLLFNADIMNYQRTKKMCSLPQGLVINENLL